MTDISGSDSARGRTLFGRLLTALGLIWLFWAIITSRGLVDLEFGRNLVSLPIFPGIVLLFIGRAIARSSRARTRREEPVSETPSRGSRSQPLRPSVRPAPERAESAPPAEPSRPSVQPSSQQTESPSSADYLPQRSGRQGKEPVSIEELVLTQVSAEKELEISADDEDGTLTESSSPDRQTGRPKTSAEMVAEARQRYGKRP